MPKHIKNSKLALIGLIILFAVTLVMAGGRKPKINNVEPTLKRLSGNEIKVMVAPIPTDALTPPMVRHSGLDKDMSREEIINGLRLSLIKDMPLLERFFSNVHFLKGIDWGIESEIIPVYLIAIIGNKLFDMPNGFNRLLVESGLEINDKNIIELAKAFVILALGSETVMREDGTWNEELSLFPQITFLEGKRIKEGYRPLHIEWDVEIKCRIDGEVQTWKFSQSRNYSKGKWIKIGQFAAAMSFVNNKAARYYQINRFEKEEGEGGRGKIDNPPGIG